jgi:LmbE family N-acetylglucosaminyl deacetylase
MTTAGAALAAIRNLPLASPRELLDGATPVVLAPHPDDEVIGCGGLLAAAARCGLRPTVVHLTDGSGSHPGSRAFPREVLIALRKHEACSAAERLGVPLDQVHFMGLRDTAAPHDGPEFDRAVEALVAIVARCGKPVIFAPWVCDPHCDHQSVSKMARRAARMLGVRHLAYLVWGWKLPREQDLGPIRVAGWRVPVDCDLKARAMEAYQSQISDLIDDDPTGFRLDHETLSMMLSDDETFLLTE